jgi:hypothetical protein
LIETDDGEDGEDEEEEAAAAAVAAAAGNTSSLLLLLLSGLLLSQPTPIPPVLTRGDDATVSLQVSSSSLAVAIRPLAALAAPAAAAAFETVEDDDDDDADGDAEEEEDLLRVLLGDGFRGLPLRIARGLPERPTAAAEAAMLDIIIMEELWRGEDGRGRLWEDEADEGALRAGVTLLLWRAASETRISARWTSCLSGWEDGVSLRRDSSKSLYLGTRCEDQQPQHTPHVCRWQVQKMPK